jgi:aldehyde dehydrogenase (NAD+)
MIEQLNDQKQLFNTGVSRKISDRKVVLKQLYKCVQENVEEISEALFKDLGKSRFESYTTEIGFALDEIKRNIKDLNSWAKPKRVKTNQLINFWSKSYTCPEAYGQVLIISPWNYPFNLSIIPLASAIAAGNLVCIKPSEYSVNTSEVLSKLISTYLPENYVKIFTGGVEVSQKLLKHQWDFIFFTGSPAIGKIVMQAAANYLTPICLELGGKSPVYVDSSANIKLAAKRIVWGKFLNAGQTCIAPDYVYVHKEVSAEFISALESQIVEFWGENPQDNVDYPKIINDSKAQRLIELTKGVDILCIGNREIKNQKLNPMIVPNCPENHPLMKEEIFGPILPVISVDSEEDAISRIMSRSKPLALYIFATNKSVQKKLLSEISSGGACVNDTIMHMSNPNLPFGGVGNSGMGTYHGKDGFLTFSHNKSILNKSNFTDPSLRYPPYTSVKLKLAKFVLK